MNWRTLIDLIGLALVLGGLWYINVALGAIATGIGLIYLNRGS